MKLGYILHTPAASSLKSKKTTSSQQKACSKSLLLHKAFVQPEEETGQLLNKIIYSSERSLNTWNVAYFSLQTQRQSSRGQHWQNATFFSLVRRPDVWPPITPWVDCIYVGAQMHRVSLQATYNTSSCQRALNYWFISRRTAHCMCVLTVHLILCACV